MQYLEKKTRFATVQWNGSNKSDVDAMLALLPTLDSFYTNFTGISTSVSMGILTVSWTNGPGGAGSVGANSGDYVIEGLLSGASNFAQVLGGLNLVPYSVVNP